MGRLIRNSALLFIMVIFTGFFIYWANQVELDEMTRIQGVVMPSSKEKVIQSEFNGRLTEIWVKLGDRLAEGDLIAKVSDEEMNKLEWHLGFIFESDNSIATSGYHVDDFVIFAVENVSRFTLDVDCKEFGSNEYPDLGFSVIPDDPNPPGMECHVNNNGYRDAQVSVISENNNESWFEPRIDHSLSQTYGSQVFVIIPPDETAIFWINQSIIPSAEVTNPNDITLFNISIIGSFNNEEYYFTSIPVSVGYHDNARIWSDASNPAFYWRPSDGLLL